MSDADADGGVLSAAEVAALRHLLGLSQAQLGGMLEVNPRTVRRWERGRSQPSPTAVEALWKLCDRHDALVRFYRRQDLVRVRQAEGWPPRGWFLAAAGRALAATPEIRVEWDDPDPDEDEDEDGEEDGD